MTLTRRQTWALVGIAFAGVIIYVLYSAATGGIGFPLDDSWIHQVYARNLAQTSQWAFVPGVPSAGSTSPFYTMLLTIGYWLPIPYWLWAYLLGAVALALCALVAARLAGQLSPDMPNAPWFVGLLVALSWHLVWAASAGMETALFAMLCTLLVGLTWRERSAQAGVGPAFGRGLTVGVIGGLVTLTRPEGVMLVGLCGLFTLIAHPHKTWKEYGAWAAGVCLGWIVFVSPNLWFNYQMNGSPFPNTSAAKQAEIAPLRDHTPLLQRILDFIYPLSAGIGLLLVPGAIFALYLLAKRVRADRRELVYWMAPVWMVAHIVLYAAELPAPFQHGRYVMPILPLFMLFGGGGTLAMVGAALRWRKGQKTLQVLARTATRSLLVAATLIAFIMWGVGATVYGGDVHSINAEMVTAAHWIAANIPTDTPFATHDIGAIGYFAPRQLVDLAGLVSPEIVPIMYNPEAKMQLMQARGVQYMMVSVSQLPIQANDPRLCPVYSTPAQNSPPELHMTIYRLTWDGRCPVSPPAVSSAAGNGSP
ncbi:MAG: hypothetical protein ACYDBJ_27700 [Aggregatilineales bacterium]